MNQRIQQLQDEKTILESQLQTLHDDLDRDREDNARWRFAVFVL